MYKSYIILNKINDYLDSSDVFNDIPTIEILSEVESFINQKWIELLGVKIIDDLKENFFIDSKYSFKVLKSEVRLMDLKAQGLSYINFVVKIDNGTEEFDIILKCNLDYIGITLTLYQSMESLSMNFEDVKLLKLKQFIKEKMDSLTQMFMDDLKLIV